VGRAGRPLFRYFNSEIENLFVVAYWDQRGAGRSFDLQADPHRLTIAQHLVDLDRVVDHLRQELGQAKIALIGHSWGSALGLLYARAHPDKVSAFIGVAQVVSTLEGQQAQFNFVLSEPTRLKDDDALARLWTIGPPPHRSAAQVLAMESLADRYGGVFHQRPNRMWIMVKGSFPALLRHGKSTASFTPTTCHLRR
jgi:pimeloyl-ACP methyl ester carboxylesterase